MKQTILTFITKVKADRVADLKALLDGMATDVEHNPHIPFPNLRLLHFASLALTRRSQLWRLTLFLKTTSMARSIRILKSFMLMLQQVSMHLQLLP